MGIIWPVAGEMSTSAGRWLAQPECSCDICPRNDQNIPFNHLHHHHWKTFAAQDELRYTRFTPP